MTAWLLRFAISYFSLIGALIHISWLTGDALPPGQAAFLTAIASISLASWTRDR